MSDDPTDLLKAELGMISDKYEHHPHHPQQHHHHHDKVITPSFEPAKVVTHKLQPKVSQDKEEAGRNEQQEQHKDEGK
ncbi:unnamed protein product [Rotaria sp. Silwood2]|nr:unnamed protein product [Rotaria sp. Silwood2]CAF2729245.1 unnamed protein product [Rotaria sp. Silwood2]CAF3137998.1 unnamed protein product [Rotaria sp. Silwood2]CAF4221158.1 unnamed protein product [Rotaria sp. Silwood2]CAF4330474.1 unnamed protein product [Rotaria sp. Silwood2]